MTLAVDLTVEAAGWEAVSDLERLLRRAVEAAVAGSGEIVAKGAEVSVLLCDDDTIRPLNRDWRGLDKPTNVLSFPAFSLLGLAQKPVLGDIAVALETVQREAAHDGKRVADHLTHLIVHGTLHLLGHDHETANEADAMEALETRILATLGIADPYAATEPVDAAR